MSTSETLFYEPLHLRVFIGSPGDVTDERHLALKVLQRLPYDPLLRGKVTFEAVAWDHPDSVVPMLAGISAQDSVIRSLGKPSDCDIVVICLWSRIGSPIKQLEYEKPTGGYYTGTEWEYNNALHAFKLSKNRSPRILLYHREGYPTLEINPTEKDAILERCDQIKQVGEFLKTCNENDGSIPNSYTISSCFEQQLESHLKEIVREQMAQNHAESGVCHKRANTTKLQLWSGSPFPGLRPFTDQDSLIFFGRGRETDELIKRICEKGQHFIAVVGASGSGKSSLIWAGLIPRLVNSTADWKWVRFAPGELGDNPFLALAACWRTEFKNAGNLPRELARELELSPDNLDLLFGDCFSQSKVLIFIDQFEELFTVVSDRYRSAFIKLILMASESQRLHIIISIRADFYAQCVEQDLAELLREGSFPLNIPGPFSLTQMMIQPAAIAGLEFEPGLEDEILRDVVSEPGALPLLAFALDQLYRKKSSEGKLTHKAYKKFNRIPGAIGHHADLVFDKLENSVKAKFTEVFRELIEVDERGVATRRRAPLKVVNSSDEASTLITKLIDARLLHIDQTREPTVEVAHEALFRSWPRLEKWVQETADHHRLRRQIQPMATYWDTHERLDEYRWPDERVLEITEMLNRLNLNFDSLPQVEQDFLEPIDRIAMIRELDDTKTSHERRAIIGIRINALGDPRKGIGLLSNALPDIDWVEIPGNFVSIEIREQQNNATSKVVDTLGQSVSSFRIARYPITVIQFQSFLHECYEGGCWKLPVNNPVKLPQDYEPPKPRERHGNYPADSINWWDAISFCHWLSVKLGCNVRLPTEFEWQLAAIGSNNESECPIKRLYPWGEEDWDPKTETWRANTYESDLDRSIAVGMYPAGVSPYGLFDMAGTLWEWCHNSLEKNDEMAMSFGSAYKPTLRCGSRVGDKWNARASIRHPYRPDYRGVDTGFRVVCDTLDR